MRFLTFLCLFGFVLPLSAQLQSPDEFLPHKLGERFTPHHLLVDYVEYVAANSNKVKLVKYGKTNEDRPLILAIISSEENMANLENIRLNNLRKTGLLEGTTDASLDRAIVWLSYSVHGNEAGGSESSMAVLYELAGGKNKEVEEWLKNTIVILDPSLNPDGYSRYSHWNRSVSDLIPNPTRGVREHREPWPGGRVNHYLFDLNRDWAWQTQVETQQRMKVYRQWMPHVHADLHEQYPDNSYYFAPAAQPYHQYLTDWQARFQTEIGKNHTKYFDKNGWLYFTKEVFDLFYPSYGDTYPAFNGAIGMTYEQAGHGISGRAILMETGDTLTLNDRIEHHKTTSLSTIEVSSLNADRIIKNFEAYFKTANNDPPGQFKTYIIKHTNNPDKMKALCRLMDNNGIRYGKATGTQGVKAFDYQEGKEITLKVESSDLLISAYQPQGVLTQVLFDPDAKLADSMTYDITAWSLPYAYGLETYATKERLTPTKEYLFENFDLKLTEDTKPYAYFLRWGSMEDARFLGALLKKGIKVRAAHTPFSNAGNTYASGTLVITRADNRKIAGFDAVVREAASAYKRKLFLASTGFSDFGGDLGSENLQLLEHPNIALLSGPQTGANSFGQLWFFFEQELEYPVDVYNAENIDRINLEDYELLILPEGYYNFSFKTREKIVDWVRGGGRVIALGNAVNAFAGQEGFALKEFATDDAESEAKRQQEKSSMDRRLDSYSDQSRQYLWEASPGAIFKLKMDNTHPLGYGFGKTYFSLKTNSLAFQYIKGAWNVGTVGEKSEVIGFVGQNALKKLANTTTFAVEDQGRGEFIYLVDNPLFRSFWENGKLLFSNAVFMK
ncbi:MAG: zinc carboxypeptidase [Saprospiraceae bacterium]|nr:zinc carboxypeptidase [Saprospiraceae bacterium]MCB9325011.1 zinc carboxypeptidase [Lewinellaceae bacterium]